MVYLERDQCSSFPAQAKWGSSNVDWEQQSSHPRMGRTGAAWSRPVQLVGIVSTGFVLGMEPGTWALFLVWLAPFPLAAQKTLGSTRASHLVELNRREQGFGRDKRTYHCSINGLVTECSGSQGTKESLLLVGRHELETHFQLDLLVWRYQLKGKLKAWQSLSVEEM